MSISSLVNSPIIFDPLRTLFMSSKKFSLMICMSLSRNMVGVYVGPPAWTKAFLRSSRKSS